MKANSVIEAQHSDKMGDANFLRFFFFCKYLTWMLQIRTCWWGTGSCFYPHLIRESTEYTLRHGHPGPKRRETKLFRRRTRWNPGCKEFLVAGWLASRHHTCTWVPRACLLTHRRSVILTISWHEWNREQGRVPGSPDSLACSWAIRSTLNSAVCTTSVSPNTLGQMSVVVEEKPGGLFL